MGVRREEGGPGRAGPRRMGRPPMADREAIVRAALDVGFSRLTMPAVAERLGVSHSTLYRYFPSRDALAAATVDHAVHRVEWPEPGDDWSAFLAATGWAHWRLYAAHPGLAQEVTGLRLTGRALVHRGNRIGLALLEFGFAAADAVLIVDMLGELVTQAFLAVPPAVGGDGTRDTSAGAAQRRRRELLGPWMEEYDPRLRGALAAAVAGPPKAWFERKLDLFLDGAAARRHRSR
ncbi:TetR/AcrR family transcriptional regulator [Streptomyces sp. HK10]|uniref:TetR/AcrR family transcriptional regulator n=1 Tax=Streptomyces sp. HK10 TaxID=3373255 RepID=UPI003748C654